MIILYAKEIEYIWIISHILWSWFVKRFFFGHAFIHRMIFEYILRYFNFSEINSQQENDGKERKTDIFCSKGWSAWDKFLLREIFYRIFAFSQISWIEEFELVLLHLIWNRYYNYTGTSDVWSNNDNQRSSNIHCNQYLQ